MKLKLNQTNIILIGDVHGHFKTLNYEIHKRREIKDSLLIQLGDFGIGFYKDNYYHDEFRFLNKELREHNNELVVIRGNHDDPNWFKEPYTPFRNLNLLEDYTLLETSKGNILCVGGAASIDKEYRVKHGWHWWEDELPVYNADKLKELEDANISYVVAHSNPNIMNLPIKEHIWGKEAEKYVLEERKILSHIYQYLQNFHCILGWFNGHYHWHHETTIKETKFITLDIMEFKELA